MVVLFDDVPIPACVLVSHRSRPASLTEIAQLHRFGADFAGMDSAGPSEPEPAPTSTKVILCCHGPLASLEVEPIPCLPEKGVA